MTTGQPTDTPVDGRHVHVRLVDGREIVRYRDTGRWYIENPRGRRMIMTGASATLSTYAPVSASDPCSPGQSLIRTQCTSRTMHDAVVWATTSEDAVEVLTGVPAATSSRPPSGGRAPR